MTRRATIKWRAYPSAKECPRSRSWDGRPTCRPDWRIRAAILLVLAVAVRIPICCSIWDPLQILGSYRLREGLERTEAAGYWDRSSLKSQLEEGLFRARRQRFRTAA
jgi:hypothetical protein